MKDQLNAIEGVNIGVSLASGMGELSHAEGVYTAKCYEYEDGPLLWEDTFDNVVCTLGKNQILQAALAGSAYSVAGPYMGLISSISWSATAAADTMASHAGWTEAGSTNAPTFAARVACPFGTAAAGSIAPTSSISFTMTGAGTLKGAFIVFGTGAVSTLMSTAGTLLSAGVFTGGDQPVNIGNVVQVTYSLGI